MSVNLSQRAGAAPELLKTMTGSTILIGTLLFNPVMIIFDNQGTVSTAIYVNNTTDVWKTFPAGEALVLDMRAANGVASNFTFDVGTSFFGNGASGAFSISYIYAINT